MTKQNKDKDAVPAATLGTNTNTPGRSTLVGKTISLNQKLESFFGVGPIWLTPQNYSCEIPDGLTDEELEVISKSLTDETIVEGKKFIAPIDRFNQVLEEYWTAIKDMGFNPNHAKGKSARDKFSSLIKKTSDRGWTAYEIAEYCMNKEIQTKGRAEVLRLLKEVLDNYFGEKTLYKVPVS